MHSGMFFDYAIVLFWIMAIEGFGIYWHAMRTSQKLTKVLKALEKSEETKQG